jgi:hypothetical protein
MSITLGSVGSGYNLSVMNQNFTLIEAFLNDVAVKRELDSEAEANEMRAHLDMNNNKIVNLPYAVLNHEPITLAQLQDIEGGVVVPGVNVVLDPTGTRFVSTETQGWMVEMDSVLDEFVKINTGEDGVDPNPPNGTPIQPYEIWLINSTEGAKSRPLPALPTDGTEVTVRDHQGNTTQNNASILRNGNTIMGLEEDLIVTVDWSWVRLKFYTDDNDWKVIGGGVGAQVKILTPDIVAAIYPVGHIIVTRNANNPFSYLGIGVWERAAVGTMLAGVGAHGDSNGTQNTIAVGINQGEWSHSQTEAEVGPHDHPVEYSFDAGNGMALVGSVQVPEIINTEIAGSGALSNITNPLDGFYIWERTS